MEGTEHISVPSVRIRAVSAEQIIQHNNVGENPTVFIINQPKGCDENVLNRFPSRDGFPQKFITMKQKTVIILIYLEIRCGVFDFTGIDHVIAPVQ